MELVFATMRCTAFPEVLVGGQAASDALNLGDCLLPHRPLGEPIRLIRRAPPAQWFEAADGGWLEFDRRLTRYKPPMELHYYWEDGRMKALWVMGCTRVLPDLEVGRA